MTIDHLKLVPRFRSVNFLFVPVLSKQDKIFQLLSSDENLSIYHRATTYEVVVVLSINYSAKSIFIHLFYFLNTVAWLYDR